MRGRSPCLLRVSAASATDTTAESAVLAGWFPALAEALGDITAKTTSTFRSVTRHSVGLGMVSSASGLLWMKSHRLATRDVAMVCLSY